MAESLKQRSEGKSADISPVELDALDHELHDLSQPLTTLQCRLELGMMIGNEAALREAVEGALLDTQRMIAALGQTRARLFGGAPTGRSSS